MVTSYPLVYKTVNDLGLNVEYFIQGNIKTTESYKYRPITFNPLDFNQKFGQDFTINLLRLIRIIRCNYPVRIPI